MAAPQKTVEIDYYGDSTIWGSTPVTGEQMAITPPIQLASELTRRCGFAVKVNNLAVRGTWAAQLLYPSNPYQMQSFAMRMASSTAQVVIPGGFGLNDAVWSDLASYTNAMREMILTARRAGKIVAVETSLNPPWGDGPESIPGWHALVGDMAAALRSIARETGTPLVEQYTTTPSTMQAIPDGLHPTQEISIQKANRAADVVQHLICQDRLH